MASWWKKIKKKLAAFLAIVALITILIAIPIMIAASVAASTIVIVGFAAAGVGLLAFAIDAEGAVSGFTKVGDGIAAVGKGVMEGATKIVSGAGEGALKGFLSSPIGIGVCVLAGYWIYTEFFEEEENVTITLQSDASTDSGVGEINQSRTFLSEGRLPSYAESEGNW